MSAFIQVVENIFAGAQCTCENPMKNQLCEPCWEKTLQLVYRAALSDTPYSSEEIIVTFLDLRVMVIPPWSDRQWRC